MDDKLKIHLNEQFHIDLTKDATTATAGVDARGGSKYIKRWYEHNQKDPWPLVVKFLSCYDCCEGFQKEIDSQINSLKDKFLYLCNQCS